MTDLPLFDSAVSDPASPSSLRVVVSPSAAARLAVAREVMGRCPPGARVMVVGASRAAADDLARDVAASVPSTFGIERLSLTQLAGRTAQVALATNGASASTRLGAEAVATRTVFGAREPEPHGIPVTGYGL
jgi:hypothetical protein